MAEWKKEFFSNGGVRNGGIKLRSKSKREEMVESKEFKEKLIHCQTTTEQTKHVSFADFSNVNTFSSAQQQPKERLKCSLLITLERDVEPTLRTSYDFDFADVNNLLKTSVDNLESIALKDVSFGLKLKSSSMDQEDFLMSEPYESEGTVSISPHEATTFTFSWSRFTRSANKLSNETYYKLRPFSRELTYMVFLLLFIVIFFVLSSWKP